jgi:hypothetical protein
LYSKTTNKRTCGWSADDQDAGAAVNVMPYATYQKLGKGEEDLIKGEEDLIKTNMMLKYFEGKASSARGAMNIELTIGSKTLPTIFFVINGKGSYNLLLGWDWIHANCCIPSTMHQCLIKWLRDSFKGGKRRLAAQYWYSRSSGVGV